jgi:hypothetical protein
LEDKEDINQMTVTKFIVSAAALSSLLVGASANGKPSINSIVAVSSKGGTFFGGMKDASVRQGWNIAATIRGGSTGK